MIGGYIAYTVDLHRFGLTYNLMSGMVIIFFPIYTIMFRYFSASKKTLYNYLIRNIGPEKMDSRVPDE